MMVLVGTPVYTATRVVKISVNGDNVTSNEAVDLLCPCWDRAARMMAQYLIDVLFGLHACAVYPIFRILYN